MLTRSDWLQIGPLAAVLVALIAIGVAIQVNKSATNEHLRKIADFTRGVAEERSDTLTTTFGDSRLSTLRLPGESFEAFWTRHRTHVLIATKE